MEQFLPGKHGLLHIKCRAEEVYSSVAEAGLFQVIDRNGMPVVAPPTVESTLPLQSALAAL